MIKIYSKKNKKKLLHIVGYKKEIKERNNISSPDEFIQVASMKLNKNQTFQPHFHIWVDNIKKKRIAQESWVVISGSVKVFYYDIDKKLISTRIIKAGDISITFHGGHNYKALTKNTLVYEFKTGPYEGNNKDKRIIRN